uniref:Uncharacterized protein n=1 Tax=Cajanus cajan TaxID=3821 RepID=A0A151TS88_CAJCA|nr:hypothetical protein KK1_009097 [Cajanus cajan]
MAGLGVKDARCMNIALLGKLVCHLVNSLHKLWVQILNAKYLQSASILTTTTPTSSSYIWRSIIKVKDALLNQFQLRLGDGSSSFWLSNWLGTGNLYQQVPYVHIIDSNLVIANFWNHNTWNTQLLRRFIPKSCIQQIEMINVPQCPQGVDVICWKPDPTGLYSSKSAYRWLNQINDNHSNPI